MLLVWQCPRLVYLQLAAMAGKDAAPVSASTSELARLVGVAQRSVFRAIAELEAAGLVEIEKTGQTGLNTYHLVVADDKPGGAAVSNHQET